MTFPTIEKAIIKGFITNEAFVTKALPYIKLEYFKRKLEKEIVQECIRFFTEYKQLPSEAAIVITVSKNLPAQENVEELNQYLLDLAGLEVQTDWLLKQTEEFCRKSDLEISVSTALDVIEGISELTMYELPKLIQDSTAISFEETKSHDFFRDVKKQFSWYKEKVDKIPFDLDMFNKITSGGVERKTLNVLLAGTGGGKSLFMCHFAAKYLEQGYNVLYITLELSENKIRQRIDANLLDIPINNFVNIEEDFYFSKLRRLQDRVRGNLKIAEFPPASVSVNHFKLLLQDLNLKDNFRPDIIFIDYLNLMNSSRIKQGKSYEVVKAIAEECRGIAVEHNACVWSGTQVNRDGYKGEEIGLENTSESMGLPFTSDIFLSLYADENLQKAQHVKVRQLKSRYGDINFYNRFIVGVDKSKMRVYNVNQIDDSLEDTTKGGSKEDVPSFDKSSFGKGMKGEKKTNTFEKWDF